ncbi:AI-2E family transporter [Oceaniradius stylonematis]|jgi:predicted PurR-regulated permease PerM|uniref:AI-2E family transporter n=1 Tax=Oceaniradius stylonematis TaxID=2184161 RepID=UPI000F3F9D4F|nr:AI-2E family transporter [Oceaniradius stylonematis]RNC91260.1 MAG: AI-2E family transporter [Oricola sp.]
MIGYDSYLFRSLATIALLIAIVAALSLAKAVFIPIFVALLLAILLHLPLAALQKAGLPRFAAAIVMIAILCGALVLFALFVSAPARTLIQDYPQMIGELRGKVFSLQTSLAEAQKVGEAIVDVGKEVGGALEGEATEVEQVVVREGNLWMQIASNFAGGLGSIAVTLTIFGFIFAIRNPFLTLATIPASTMASKLDAARLWKGVESDVSHYFFVTTLINIGLGTVVGLVLWALDVPMPIFWGFVVGVLNYMPFVGPTIGAALLLAVSIVQFGTIFQMLMPAAAYLVINFIEANFVTPNMVGRRVNIAPLAIILSLLFWGWLWGFAGLLVSIPMLVVLNAVAERVEALSALNRMLTPRARRDGRIAANLYGTRSRAARLARERRVL